jgi:hypothetical protein
MNYIDIAKGEIGKEEVPIGSNWGPDVQKYLASVGIDFPASWCMAFVYWCCQQGGESDKLLKTGGVLAQWNHADPSIRFSIPKAGDIFIMDFGQGLGHTGFVESVKMNKIFTIEGNTNDTGSREGYEVCRRVRQVSSCKGFIRIN